MRRCARRKFKAVVSLVVILAIVISCLLYFRGNLIAYVDKYAGALITTRVVDIFNSSTTEALTGEMFQDKSNFYEIRYDKAGHVSLLSG
ncbi:MAG: hypothetical protein K2N53_06870, partial [Clostridia bacterium]|nr:hypothetical protein [Clostridia bacterium]